VDVRHHVVPEAPLVRRDRREVDVVEVRAHLRDRFVGNRIPSACSASASASQSWRQRPWRVADDHRRSMSADAYRSRAENCTA
jgi:hypothetical protein